MTILPPSITHTLIREGFTPSLTQGELIFRSHFTLQGYTFNLRIEKVDPEFINLPHIFLEQVPNELGNHLPHRGPDGKLCYLDDGITLLDRFAPEESIYIILNAVKSLLKSYITKDQLDLEFAHEFKNYWGGGAISACYLRSKELPLIAHCFQRESSGENEKETILECVVGKQDQIESWKSIRNCLDGTTIEFKVAYLKIKEMPVLSTHQAWPPQRLTDVLIWLESLDINYVQLLTDQIVQINSKHAVVIISTPTGDIGLSITLSQSWLQYVQALKKQKQRKSKGKAIRQKLMSEKSAIKIERFSVSDATDDHIFTRNQPNIGMVLSGKRIAVIGCGTIGGYLADLLQKTGAGLRGGCLKLFDHDFLGTENIGRHVLGPEYIGEPKSTAMQSYLKSQNLSSAEVEVGFSFDPQTINDGRWDLIIDATGFQRFSNSLSHKKHDLRSPITILHVWIDAGGQAVRALLDDNTGACYRCLSIDTGKSSQERFDLGVTPDTDQLFARHCGEYYTPFSTSVSVHAAGIGLNMAQAYLSGLPLERFQHFSMNNSIRKTKNQNPEPTKNCPNCQKNI